MINYGSPYNGILQAKECWSGLPFATAEDLPDPGIKPASPVFPALVGGFFTTSATWEAYSRLEVIIKPDFSPVLIMMIIRSDQIRSVTQSCPTLCDPMNCSTPGLPVHHQLPEFTQTHVHRVSDTIQSYPLSSLSLPAPNPSQHQGLF